jgi:hypothetical protein
MDTNIKKESVNPSNNDLITISEKSSNEGIKKQIVDDRYDDVYVGNKKVNDKASFRRPAYPWEDSSIFERDESEENLKIIRENYQNNNKEEKYTANTQNLVKKSKVKYKSEPDKYVTVKMEAVKNLQRAAPINQLIAVDGGGILTYMPPDGGVKGEYSTKSEDVKKRVVQMLKARGLTLSQAAGIMGNIQAESSFNPNAGSIDSNGLPSVGLVQFNGGSYVGAKTIEGMFAVIGRTVDSQLNYLFNTRKFNTFLKKSNGQSDYKVNAFLFAKYFEGCSICTTESKFFKSPRPGYAKGFYEKLQDSSSPLYWQSN